MQDAERRRAQTLERRAAVEVSHDGHDAVSAKLRGLVAATRETIEPGAAVEQRRSAQRDVTATDQQNPDHDPERRRFKSGV